ncbi:MAG TPA: hypothetical protein VMW34_12430 [Anaerolineales bacterium]|nr:hypothetical protein [Anaerolineales bacterium]
MSDKSMENKAHFVREEFQIGGLNHTLKIKSIKISIGRTLSGTLFSR